MRMGLVFLGLVLVVAPWLWGQEADPWAAGCSLEPWQRIRAIQRYPFYDAEAPDWAGLAGDESPLVRAVAAIGIGRTGDAGLVPLLVPMLDEDGPLLRHCALWALVQMESDGIKKPLLKALRTSEEMNLTVAGFDFSPLQWRLGFPFDFVHSDRERRRAWLEGFDEVAWRVGSAASPRPGLSPRICIGESEINSGEPLDLRIQLSNEMPGPDASKTRISLEEYNRYWDPWSRSGRWHPIKSSLALPKKDESDSRAHLYQIVDGEKREERIMVRPGETLTLDFTAVVRSEPLKPGIYLFQAHRRARIRFWCGCGATRRWKSKFRSCWPRSSDPTKRSEPSVSKGSRPRRPP